MNVRIASRTTMRSGFITSRIVVRRAVAQDRRSSRRGCAPGAATSSMTASLGSGMSSSVRANGRAAAISRRSQGNTFSSHQRADVREREQAQRLAGGRAVDDDRVELGLVVVALDLEQREELVHAGRHGQLLGRDPVDAAARRAARRATPGPPPSGAPSRPGPGPPGPRADRRTAWARCRARPRANRTGCARGRSRARSCAGPRARSGGRWRRPRWSCRRRPCPCRGSSVEPLGRDLNAGR